MTDCTHTSTFCDSETKTKSWTSIFQGNEHVINPRYFHIIRKSNFLLPNKHPFSPVSCIRIATAPQTRPHSCFFATSIPKQSLIGYIGANANPTESHCLLCLCAF